MRINAVFIRHFAGLSNAEFRFDQPFSCIYGENEAGKTTVMRFIRMMLYGSNTALRNECRPLSGEAMSGSLLFSDGGKEYQLDRSFGKSRRSDRISLTDLRSGETVSVSSQPGELFLGISEDIFVRSCFVGSVGTISGEKGSEEIRQRMQNLVSAGNETVSVGEVQKRLSAAARTIRNKSFTQGKLTEAAGRLEELEEQLIFAVKREEAFCDLDRQIKSVSEEILTLKKKLAQLKKEQAVRQRQLLQNLKLRCSQLESRLAPNGEWITRERLTACQREANEITWKEQQAKGNVSEELLAYYNSEKQKLDALEHDKPALERMKAEDALREENAKEAHDAYCYRIRFPLPTYLAVIGAFCLILGLIGSTLNRAAGWIVLAVMAVPMLIGAGIWQFCRIRRRTALKEAWNSACRSHTDVSVRLSELQLRIGNSERMIQELGQQISRAQKVQSDTAEFAKCRMEIAKALVPYGLREWGQVTSLTESLIKDHDEWQMLQIKIKAVENPTSSGQEQELNDKLHRLELEYAKLSGAVENRDGQISVSELEEQIRAQKDEVAALQKKYAALNLAAEVLNESFAELGQQFGGILNGQTAAYLSALTDGKYKTVTVDKDLHLQTKKGNNGMLAAQELLSAGTADQAFLALRLAIAKLISGESGHSLPIFLDDSFIQYDDKRCENAMRLIAKLTESGEFSQAILFTCHQREKRIHQDMGEGNR